MKAKYILPALALAMLASCEDYTEHYFGTDKDLYQTTQVNSLEFTLDATHYTELAKNETARQLALAENPDSSVLRTLESVAEKGYLPASLNAADYLGTLLLKLCGAGSYYSMNAGSTVLINYLQSRDTLVSEAAYVPATQVKDGKYLLAVKGQEQVLANHNNAATGQTYSYGRISLSGTERCPAAITRFSDEAIKIDNNAKEHLYEFMAVEGGYFIMGPTEEYLYCDETHTTFNFIDDLSELELDMAFATWTVEQNADGTATLRNTGNGMQVMFDTQYGNAQLFTDEQVATNEQLQPIVPYAEGQFSSTIDTEPSLEQITYTLKEEDGQLKWLSVGDYLNQALTNTGNTSDIDEIFTLCKWTVRNVGSIGDLTYVWKLDNMYGLRASAYKGKAYPVDSWIISPAMNLKRAEAPVLTFEEAQKYCGTPLEDYIQVWVSTVYEAGNDVDMSQWTNVTDQLQGTRPDGSNWNYLPMSLDLSAYAGEKNVRVAFRYISDETYAATWEIKNIRAAEPETE